MPFLATPQTENNQPVQLFYLDTGGSGQPVVLIHGWPASHRMWERQIAVLADAGFRVIAYDRRGFGDSSQPWGPYDYDTLAEDLRSLVLGLDLRDCVLVGFSMGGGEVVRYFTNYGTDRVAKAALVSSIIPLVAQKSDNPDGVPAEALDDILQSLQTDRVQFLEGFGKNFFNADDNPDTVSAQQLYYSWNVAAMASPRATVECAKAWSGTDFRPELKNVTVPTLIVHGDADQIVPKATSADQAAKGIAHNQYEVITGGSHGLNVSHAQAFNKILLGFLGA